MLPFVLSALEKQSCKAFDVLAVVKPSGDGTEEVIRGYEHSLNISLFLQKSGFVMDAIKIGLKHATGDIIAFLDDDAIPAPNWIERQVRIYENPLVGGVAGEVIPTVLNKEKGLQFDEGSSEILASVQPFSDKVAMELWERPLDGLQDYLVYISKAGLVSYNYKVAMYASNHKAKSLLGMGANMSVLAKALKGIKLPQSWVLGLSYEQFLGWYIWKQGYSLIFDPNAKVYHLAHGQTLSRNVTDNKKDTLRQVESRLLFYRLYALEPSLSKKHRLLWLIFDAATDLKKICLNKECYRIRSFRSKVYSEIIGIKWLISRRFGGTYNPVSDLKRILNKYT